MSLEYDLLEAMCSIAVIADDLTGVLDTTHMFAKRGFKSSVLPDPKTNYIHADISDSPVVGINTDTRYAAPEFAGERVEEALSTAQAEIVYKKVDSTLRGNLASEISSALSHSGAGVAVVAPAYPRLGRKTRDGIHYVDSTPVALTEYADDENGPQTSILADLFSDLDRPVAHIGINRVAGGPDAIVADLEREIEQATKSPIVIVDATQQTHLSALANAASQFNSLYAGSAGLAEHVATPTHHQQPRFLPSGSDSTALGIVGSVNSVTMGQLARVPNDALVTLDPEAVLLGKDPHSVDYATKRLENNQFVVITAAKDGDDVDKTIDIGKEQGLTPTATRNCVASGLADIAASIINQANPSGIFCSGGDIAISCLQALETEVIIPTGTSIASGIPVSRLADGYAAGTPIVTKAGGFGTSSAIVNCLERLSKNDA